MLFLAEASEIKAKNLSDLVSQAMQIEAFREVGKAVWVEVEDNIVLAEGGICLDEECNCQGSWINWTN